MTVAVENTDTLIVPADVAAGPFATGWTFAAPADVQVIIETDGVEAAPLTAGVDYTLVAPDPTVSGGEVTLDAGAVPEGGWNPVDGAVHRIILRRWTAADQTEPFGDYEGFRPPVAEGVWDRDARRSGEERTLIARMLKVPAGEAGLTLPPAAKRAGYILAFDDAGAVRPETTVSYIIDQAALTITAVGLAQLDAATVTHLADLSAAELAHEATLNDYTTTQVSRVTAEAEAQIADMAAVAQSLTRYFSSTAEALSNGVVGMTALVGGAGGADGTYTLAFTGGGGGSGAAGVFTVSGGAVISVQVTAPGVNYTAAPAADFSACAGLAGAGVTVQIGQNRPAGTFFYVPNPAGGGFDLYKNVAGVATYIDTFADEASVTATLTAVTEDDRRSLIANANAARAIAYRDRPIALVLVLTGQSNHQAQIPAISAGFSPDAYMPTLGPSTLDWRYSAYNSDYTVHYADISGATPYLSKAGETTVGGHLLNLLGGKVRRVYAASAAMGGKKMLLLQRGGERNTLHAVIRYLCKAARDAGYRPVVAGCHSQGESDVTINTPKATFKAYTIDYIRQFQYLAALEMDDPTWVAPVAVDPIVNFRYAGGTLSFGRDILEALYEAAHETPGAFLTPSPGYDLPHNADRTHKTNLGMILYGEHEARSLRAALLGGEVPEPLNVVDCWRSLTTPTRVWYRLNAPGVVDLAYDFGTSAALYPGNKDGLGYADNGAIIPITAHDLKGALGYVDLQSAPVGATAQQQMLFGTMDMGTVNSAATDHMPGTRIRADEAATLAKWDGVTSLHRFLLLRTITPREVA